MAFWANCAIKFFEQDAFVGGVLVDQIQPIRSLGNEISSPDLANQAQKGNGKDGGLRIVNRRLRIEDWGLKIGARRLYTEFRILIITIKIMSERPGWVDLGRLGRTAP